MVTKRLIMSFVCDDLKKTSISIDNPREDLTGDEIKEAMDLILSKNIFNIRGGAIAKVDSAEIVQTNTTEYDYKA